MKPLSILLPILGSVFLLGFRLWLDRRAVTKGRDTQLLGKTKVAFSIHYDNLLSRFVHLSVFIFVTYILRYGAVAFLLWSIPEIFEHGVPVFGGSHKSFANEVFFSVATLVIPAITIGLSDALLGLVIAPLFGFIEMFIYAGFMLSGVIGATVTAVLISILLFMMLNGPDLSVGSPRWSWWFWYIRRRH